MSQAFSVKRAQVEFHNFASLGEPEIVMAHYADENVRRGAVIRNHLAFVGEMSPYLEIGANAGHTSFMLSNEFGAHGFALDISADALRYGLALKDAWGLSAGPIRIAGDALNLPFRDNSLRMVCAFQMLSQFMNIESVFLEVKRILAPGGIFLFAEEPLRRTLSLRLYRAPYYNTMKPWERKLYDMGLLGYLTKDVIGAHQEESFGIRQNHTMGLKDWHKLIARHFVDQEYEIFVPERGWGERVVKRFSRRLDRLHSDWKGARLLGGTLAAVCRKGGNPQPVPVELESFERYLRCPDCHKPLNRNAGDTLLCPACGYSAPNEGGVYNVLPSGERKELYPGDRDDVIDFSLPGHTAKLLDGWYELEGVFGNKYRWIGERASARLTRVHDVPQRIRIRGHVHPEQAACAGRMPRVTLHVNGSRLQDWDLDRTGLFILEADLPPAETYMVVIEVSPAWEVPEDDRRLSLNLSMLRLIDRD